MIDKAYLIQFHLSDILCRSPLRAGKLLYKSKLLQVGMNGSEEKL